MHDNLIYIDREYEVVLHLARRAVIGATSRRLDFYEVVDAVLDNVVELNEFKVRQCMRRALDDGRLHLREDGSVGIGAGSASVPAQPAPVSTAPLPVPRPAQVPATAVPSALFVEATAQPAHDAPQRVYAGHPPSRVHRVETGWKRRRRPGTQNSIVPVSVCPYGI